MKFSIITACLNAERFLRRTLNSVLSQQGADYEILVQDGGSSDGSLEMLQAYSRRINWRSEPDAGIYDAWNRAVARASGDWAVFLGADDFFIADDVLQKSAVCLAKMPGEVDFAYGSMALGRKGRPSTRIRNSLCGMYSEFLRGIGLPFPSTFVRLSTLKEHSFDPSFKIAGDFDLTARILTPDNVARLPHFVTFMERGGVSDNPELLEISLAERARILRRHIMPKAAMIAGACLKYLDERLDLDEE